MIFALLFISFLAKCVVGANTASNTAQPQTCDNLYECRSLWSLIRSSLTTIFLCTWVAIHPNVPEPIPTHVRQSIWRKWHFYMRTIVIERLSLFVCALLVPEYILAWAIRQRMVADEMVREWGYPGFTRAHGFFVTMGGLYHRGDPIYCEPDHPIDRWDAHWLLKYTELQLPKEEEILDKGKHDWLTKSLVIIQVIWFIIQCIARGIQGLPTTELEVIALAYTTINLGIYLAWFEKPYDMHTPLYSHQSLPRREVSHLPQNHPIVEFTRSGWTKMVGIFDYHMDLCGKNKVPTFYSGGPSESQVWLSNGITLVAALVFGAVHCIAWSFNFPSYSMLLLWRLSSGTMVVVPTLILGSFGLCMLADKLFPQVNTYLTIFMAIFMVSVPLLLLCYVAARVISLVVALMALAHPHPGVYKDISWTGFIPHL